MNSINEELLRLWINNVEGIGIKTIKKLIKQYGCLINCYDASLESLKTYLKDDVADKLYLSKNMEYLNDLKGKYDERGIKIIYPGHDMYPELLLEMYDYPEVLYVKGDLNVTKYKTIGVVGSRFPSNYGVEMTRYIVDELAKNNVCVVSGLARGIDTVAHTQTIASGGKTIAVLGCGINVTYPKENAELYSRIENNGAIISEYGLNVSPSSAFFPIRNRIISGLSSGVFVVQAKKKSGSLITADCALEQGKQVYAMPGSLNDCLAEGTNNLIKQGACIVTCANDILEDFYGVREEAYESKSLSKRILDKKNGLSNEELMIYDCLSLEPTYIDDVVKHSKCGIRNTISVLYILEQKQVIKQVALGYYVITL